MLGLQAGIEGGIHAIRTLWEQCEFEENWGFLLVDARNAFNKLNRTVMLWTIRHEWTAGARFALNCYQHHLTLVIRNKSGDTAVFLLSREGVTQGDPLAMVGYGVGVLPLIRKLKAEFPTVSQPWYADDAGAGAKFTDILAFFKRLKELGPQYGYFPEASKSILVVRESNLEAAEKFFSSQQFRVTTGERYLGGYIGAREDQDEWVDGKTTDWTKAVRELAKVAVRYPQSAYAGLQKSLQQEWQFLQRVVPSIGEKFEGVEKAISDDFLPALFNDKIHESDKRWELAGLPVKHTGLALPNPTTSTESNYEASTLVCSHIVAAFRGIEEFQSEEHESVRRSVLKELTKRKTTQLDETLDSILSGLPCDTRRTIRRGKETGLWLTTLPSTVNGTELSAQEFRDQLLLRYARSPGDLPSQCDGCGQAFSVQHAMTCKKGGLVIIRHNEIGDELADIASKALTPSAVRDEPTIYPHGCASENVKKAQETPSASKSPIVRPKSLSCDEDRGDLLIQGLWARGTDCIIDVRVTDLDCKSNRSKDPHKVLAQHEQAKKKKYLEACTEQRRHFSPFAVSTDGVIGKEARALLWRLLALLADKWDQPYSVACGYVNACMSIAIAQATHLCLRGSRVPTGKMSNRRPQWEDRAGLSLFRD